MVPADCTVYGTAPPLSPATVMEKLASCEPGLALLVTVKGWLMLVPIGTCPKRKLPAERESWSPSGSSLSVTT